MNNKIGKFHRVMKTQMYNTAAQLKRRMITRY